MEWYNDPNQLAAFARAMYDSAELVTVEDVIECLEELHKWKEEYRIWASLGKPQEGDESWDEFTEAIDELKNG